MYNNSILSKECYQIVGACMNVHKELGSGFHESIYQDALEVELSRLGIPFIREKELSIVYKGVKLKTFYKADFVCYDQIIVEIKALNELHSVHTAQVLNYLKVSNLPAGLLINFGEQSLKHEKYVRKNVE